MDKEVYDWFRKRDCVGTKECIRTMGAVLYLIQNGFPKKGSLYKILAEESGENYYTFSRSISRGTKKIWERDSEIFRSKDDPKPDPITILHDLVFHFSGEKIV